MIETPRLPGETYQTLLNHGAAKHIPIQAGEVAWMPGRPSRGVAALVQVLFIVAGLVLILFLGACLQQLGVF
jgi:hypothetical protein